MPADSSIYGLIKEPRFESPMQGAGQAFQLRALMDQSALQGLQRHQIERGIADEDAKRALAVEAGGDPMKLRDLLRGRGLFKPAMELDKQILETKKTQGEIDSKEAETVGRLADQWRNMLAPVQDAATYDAFRVRVSQDPLFSRFAGSLPQQFDPNWVRTNMLTATQAYEKTRPHWEMKNTGKALVPVQMNSDAPGFSAAPLTMTTTPGEDQANARAISEGKLNRGVTIRGQNMVDARSGQTYDTDRGVVVDTRAATARPVTAGGSALGQKQPESSRKELAALESQENTVAEALRSVQRTPGAFSMQRGLATMAGTIPETLANAGSSDKNIQARSFVFNVVSKVINERAGAAQSAQELARLRSFLPAETDNATVIESKLKGFQKYIGEQKKAYQPKALGQPAASPSLAGWAIEEVK